MRLRFVAIASCFLEAVIAAPRLPPFSTFSNVTIFVPPANYTDPQTLYARTVELEAGVLLATWENYSPEPPLVYFPIFQSTNGGETWKEISKVMDQVNNWGLRYQPMLYELPAPVGRYAAGTVLLAGNSIPTDLNYTQIDVYASEDKGYTWHFVSRVASGGAAIPDNGIPAIWEPFLMYYEGKIVVYYSDQVRILSFVSSYCRCFRNCKTLGFFPLLHELLKLFERLSLLQIPLSPDCFWTWETMYFVSYCLSIQLL
jgi:hypothetical protein